MNIRLLDYSYILATILFTVYGQIVVKWRVREYSLPPMASLEEKFKFIGTLLLDPIILSAFAAAFLAGIAWMIAMTKFDLSYAYPFTALNFILILVLSSYFFNDEISFQKIIGIAIIGLGVYISSR